MIFFPEEGLEQEKHFHSPLTFGWATRTIHMHTQTKKLEKCWPLRIDHPMRKFSLLFNWNSLRQSLFPLFMPLEMQNGNRNRSLEKFILERYSVLVLCFARESRENVVGRFTKLASHFVFCVDKWWKWNLYIFLAQKNQNSCNFQFFFCWPHNVAKSHAINLNTLKKKPSTFLWHIQFTYTFYPNEHHVQMRTTFMCNNA